ncbi:MAG: efflux RND transporter permease subunit [Campylobacterales bacterium]|nr:efflux RND transporter permease subunit [Campylobacterales bacterium]
MARLVDFFLKNVHLNHVLLAFLLVSGVYAYIKIPKELFPDTVLEKIVVSGSYAGASASNLEKIAVRDIEEEIGSISGVSEIESIITPGTFSIVVSLDTATNPSMVLDKVRDAIANIRRNLPEDMNEPTAKQMDKIRDLINVSIASEALSYDDLLEEAKVLRRFLLRIEDISEVEINGDADKRIEVRLNKAALHAYALSPEAVIGAVSNLSYAFPIGNIDDPANFAFISTVNGKANQTEWEETRLHVSGKYVRLGDIAKVAIYHPQESSLGSFNAKPSITLELSKIETGNSIELSKIVRAKLKAYEEAHPGLTIETFQDSSKPIKNRLSVIISNLTLGLILIFFSMYYLINRNTAIVVTMGVPFAFVIGLLFIYMMGYSLNVISLIGALLVIGIAVDDAVVVSENIQRHIDEGVAPDEAAKRGVMEMLMPVTMATLTTVAAFFPLFMLSQELGLFLKLIPVVVIMVLLGSLLESFFFLPLHAKHLLKKGERSRDWSWLNDRYEWVLHRLLRHKLITLGFFFLLVPLLSVLIVKHSNFQFFPSFDGDRIYVSGKLSINTKVEESFEIGRAVEREVLKYKEELGIKSVSHVSGKRKNLLSQSERGENLFYLTIELHEMVDTNFVNRYLNPLLDLSFAFDNPEKSRTLYSYQVAKKLREYLSPLEKRYTFEEFAVIERRVGLVRTDIGVNLIGSSDEKTQEALELLKRSLASVHGVSEVADNVRLGKMEYKIRITPYGEQLGLSEKGIASVLSGYFLGNRKATTFDDNGVVEITTEFDEKDSLQKLIAFQLPLEGGGFVALGDVAELIATRDYEYIEKRDGDIVKTVSANVDKTLTTASQVLEEIRPVLEQIEQSGIGVKLRGEEEKNVQLRSDMLRSVGMALLMMLILLLIIFPKIKYALMILSVIPFSIFGALAGHWILGMNLAMPSIIGMLGLAGVVINDGIIMLDFLHGTHKTRDFYYRAKLRLRPIIITSLTTFLGLSTLIFFATGQAKIMQPLAVSLGFGLLWGTVMNLFYLPTLYALVNKIKPEDDVNGASEAKVTALYN